MSLHTDEKICFCDNCISSLGPVKTTPEASASPAVKAQKYNGPAQAAKKYKGDGSHGKLDRRYKSAQRGGAIASTRANTAKGVLGCIVGITGSSTLRVGSVRSG